MVLKVKKKQNTKIYLYATRKTKNDFQRRLAGGMEELSTVPVAGLLAPVIHWSMVPFSNSAKKPTFSQLPAWLSKKLIAGVNLI